MQNAVHFHVDDTIVAVSSAVGPAVRAIIRLSGPNAWPILRTLFPSEGPHRLEPRVGYETKLVGVASLPPIPVMVIPFLAPHSYTGQDLAELHLPGSPVLVQAVLEALLARGARLALPGEFTLRAFLAGKMDLTRAEALLAVLHSQRPDTLQEALRQFAGNIATPLTEVKDRLLDLLAEVEASLDFPEEDLLFAVRDTLIEQCRQVRERLSKVLQRIAGRGLVRPTFRAVLAGRPNAGKSSLFNALLGESSAIVSPIAGTTRDYLTATRVLDGVLVELVDTAGIEPIPAELNASSVANPNAAITAQAQAFRSQQVQQADLVLYCLPVAEEVTSIDISALAQLEPKRTILVWTKCDLAPSRRPFPKLPERFADWPHMLTSAITGQGLAELAKTIAAKAREHFESDPLAVSLGRCEHHLQRACQAIEHAEALLTSQEPPELVALELRTAVDELGAVLGEVYTEDLLDRIFSRFCIGK